MNKIAYTCLKGVLFMVSLIPLRISYILLSNFLYFILRYVAGYRKKVVKDNLKLVFPEKSDAEIKSIIRKFYHHLADVMVEISYSLYMPERSVRKRVHFTNIDLINEYYAQGKNIVGVTGHYANWEWGYGFPMFGSHKLLAIYKKLHNETMDKLFNEIRSRFGSVPVEMSNVLRTIVTESKKKPVFVYMVADQSPAGVPNWYYTSFLGVDGTPVFTGPERIARTINAVYLYIDIQKIKRGYYHVKMVPICENSKDTEPNYLTEEYLRLLEKQIYNKPEYWMWSHKRWKRRKTE